MLIDLIAGAGVTGLLIAGLVLAHWLAEPEDDE